jgi:beta-aspartyl-peptidase (threonine type)
MKHFLAILAFFLLNKSFAQNEDRVTSDRYVLVIHGGAGTILKSQMTPEREKAYRESLDHALETGKLILEAGGTALDAVEAAVRIMEDNPLFNAGKGAVFTNEGKNELDASIMDGKTLAAGSVAGVTKIRNPITAARAVMEHSPHVMMVGPGAEKFAKEQDIPLVDPSYFFTESRWNSLQRAKRDDSLKTAELIKQSDEIQKSLDSLMKHVDEVLRKTDSLVKSADSIMLDKMNKQVAALRVQLEVNRETRAQAGALHNEKYGTVGAVALDRHGNLAAATSTGGMTNKRFGRVGDAPIIGAGTYANNATVAISGTGWGEFFIRLVMAKSVSDMMEFGKWTLDKAAHEMIMKRLPALGGDGGLIAVDHMGNIAMPFCTEGMYRGYIKSSGEKKVAIYREEK